MPISPRAALLLRGRVRVRARARIRIRVRVRVRVRATISGPGCLDGGVHTGDDWVT